MLNWALDELGTADFGDKRLKRRFIKMVELFSDSPGQSIPATCKTLGNIKGTYRFLASEKVKANRILQAHFDSTCRRMSPQDVILCIQDTTYLDYTKRKIKDMGCVGGPQLQGLLVHSTLCATSNGVPLGLISQETWSRDPKQVGRRNTRRQRTTEQKESQRWLDALIETEATAPRDSKLITIADREADIFDFFAQPRRENSELLLRVNHNRRVEEVEGHLLEAIHNAPAMGKIWIEIKRGDERPSREAELVLRFGSVTILPPKSNLNHRKLSPVQVQLILAKEEQPPAGQSPVSWLLLTTLPINTAGEAAQCLEWYSKRWIIERFHYVLKSGCQIESLQLETTEGIKRALGVYSIVAWRLLWLTYEARKNPNVPCTVVLKPEEWQALYVRTYSRGIIPPSPPTLKQAVLLIAKLGGFLGRKGDGEPGVKTIWRGLVILRECAEVWSIAQEASRTRTCG